MWTVALVVIGLVLPVAVALVTVVRCTGGSPPGMSGLVRAFGLGILFGALGGAAVSGLVIGLVLLLRAAL